MFEDREAPTIPGVIQPEPVALTLKQTIAQILGLKRVDRFPGAQPVSFERRHIALRLMKHDYYVCEKLDGLRFLLLILAESYPDGTFEEGIFLVSRLYEFYRVPNMHFPISKDRLSVPHNGTIVDGELVLDKKPDGSKELRFLVFDLLAVNGTLYTNRPTDKRLAHIRDLIDPYYAFRQKFPEKSAEFAFKVSFKTMKTCSKIPQVLELLPHLAHVSDGLIFTCCETPYVFETDQTLLKWKPAEENTIDFRLEMKFHTAEDEEGEYYDYDLKPIFELYEWTGGEDYVLFGHLTVSDEEWEQLKALGQPLNKRVAEVKKNEKGEWNLLRFRDDKEHGNHSSVVKKILHSISDGVTKEELIKASPEIEQQWGRRGEERKQLAERRKREREEERDEDRKRGHGIVPTYDFDDD